VGDGPEREQLEALARSLGLMSDVVFWGWQARPEKWYREANVFVLTSEKEGWGMAVVEALSYELPILMTDVGLAGEVVQDGENGIVIPIGDSEALKRGMTQMIEDSTFYNKLKSNTRDSLSHLPTFEQTLALYKKGWKHVAVKTKSN